MMTDDTQSLGACFKHWRLQKGWPLEVIALKTRIPAKYLRALESNDFSTLPPIESLHHTLGESLLEHRKRQGLSIESIAERTRVPLASLQALEENNSAHLPEAPVIVRAFVDAYLNCLALQESEKEAVLLQFAKMMDSVYAKPGQESTDPPPPVDAGSRRTSSTPSDVWSAQLHDHALGVYFRLADWRTTFCRRAVLAGQASLAYADHLFDRASSLSAQAGHTVSQNISTWAGELMERTRPDGGWSALWQRIRTGLSAGTQRTWHAGVSVCRILAPLVRQLFVRQPLIEKTPSSEQPPTPTPQNATPLEGRTWVWLVQYGITVLLLLMLGSTATTIPLFKETALVGTKLAASNLVAFLGYGGALLMVWLMSRKAWGQFVRNGSGFTFLRPLGAPFTGLLGVSASYKLLLTLVGPFLGKADQLAYNWIFVFLILATTLWLIRTWFFKSAPLLESLETTGHPKQSGRIAVASLRD
jgi:transcriptional regulator with XRE-family HTH domain